MSIRPVSCAILAAACLAVAGTAGADDVRGAVEAANAAFVAAFKGGDGAAVADLYTEDAVVVAPGAPAARGHSAIAAFWQQTIDSGIADLTLTTDEVDSTGDLAYETGTVRLVAGDGATSEARYLVIWKRIDGSWRLHRDIWNAAD